PGQQDGPAVGGGHRVRVGLGGGVRQLVVTYVLGIGAHHPSSAAVGTRGPVASSHWLGTGWEKSTRAISLASSLSRQRTEPSASARRGRSAPSRTAPSSPTSASAIRSIRSASS